MDASWFIHQANRAQRSISDHGESDRWRIDSRGKVITRLTLRAADSRLRLESAKATLNSQEKERSLVSLAYSCRDEIARRLSKTKGARAESKVKDRRDVP